MLSACAAPQSSFAFNLSGDATGSVNIEATGEIDDAGDLALDNDAWQLDMSLGGLSTGNHNDAEVTILRKTDGAIFTTTVGGTCTVILDPHDSSNGSPVNGVFYCTGLMSSTGMTVGVTGGEFLTEINDSENDPGASPPGV